MLRKRQERNWSNYFATLPKFSVTWDRSAARPVVRLSKPEPKPRPRPRPRPRQQKPPPEPEPPREPTPEIVFVTPPLTPPPAPPEIVELPQEFQRDDDFWQFFDQPVPR